MSDMHSHKALTILGFDFGSKRIGVAVGQTLTQTANPLNTLHLKSGKIDWESIDQLIKQWRPNALVVGIPWQVDGTSQKITELTLAFADELMTRFELPVHRVDERYTTVDAKQALFDQAGYKHLKKNEIDSWAAKLILESWLRETSREK